MIVQLPPPADLQVDQISVPPTATMGQPLVIEWTVSNHGGEKVEGFWSDSAYLSDDAVWDLGDKLIGTFDMGAPEHSERLDPGEGYAASLTTTLPTALPGEYHVIERTDIFDDIHEGADDATRHQDFALDGLADNPDFVDLLRRNRIETMHTLEATLEDVFVEVTGRRLR